MEYISTSDEILVRLCQGYDNISISHNTSIMLRFTPDQYKYKSHFFYSTFPGSVCSTSLSPRLFSSPTLSKSSSSMWRVRVSVWQVRSLPRTWGRMLSNIFSGRLLDLPRLVDKTQDYRQQVSPISISVFLLQLHKPLEQQQLCHSVDLHQTPLGPADRQKQHQRHDQVHLRPRTFETHHELASSPRPGYPA